jgi:ribokinase
MTKQADRSFDVVVCGSLHLDIVVSAPHLPQLDETVPGKEWRKVCGGKGGNQAVMAARAGARTAMIGMVGDDAFGATLRDHLTARSVNTEHVAIAPTLASGMSVAILDNNGDYGAVIVSGANLMIDAAQAALALATRHGTKVLVLQNEINETVNLAISRAAKDLGCRIILNAAPARDMPETLLDLVDILVVNRVEAEALSGMAINDVSGAVSAIALLANGKRDTIITMGNKGLVYMHGRDPAEVVKPVAVTTLSSHGAGDCFVGYLAATLARGNSLRDSVNRANRAAAAHVAGLAMPD